MSFTRRVLRRYLRAPKIKPSMEPFVGKVTQGFLRSGSNRETRRAQEAIARQQRWRDR